MKLLRNNAILCNGKYKIERVLGQGGFGITYLAKQKVSVAGALGTIDAEIEVTIKEFFMKELCNRDEASSMVTVPSTGSAELVEKFRQKFIKEAKNISKLTHPHIIKVLDVFEENGTAYYVMEYIDGGSLSDLIEKNGSLSEDETLKYTRQIASALQYIHAHKMNHLDVKPGNVLLRKNGDVVLIDFGMSKNYDVAGEQTTSSPVGVSVGYAPIERSRVGGLGMFSPETDIYSLGATMFKMLTGQTPPEATAVFDEGLPELPMEISEQTKLVIEKAMQPRRKERYHSIEDFLDALGTENVQAVHVKNEKVQPEEYGEYYRWANGMNGHSLDGFPTDKEIAGTKFDVAYLLSEGKLKTPTRKQFKELIDRCRWSWITYNGTTGCKVTGPSGKSIFLPGAGRKSDYGIYRKDSFGYYWSSSRGHGLNAYYLYFNEEDSDLTYEPILTLRSIRPICE